MGDFTTLALDLGGTLGWALGKNGVIVQSGEVALFSKDAHPGHRWLRFHEWLYDNHRDVNAILYEDVMFFGNNGVLTARVYAGLLAKVQEFSLVHKKTLRALGPGTIKKEFAGNGRADKHAMCETAINLGWKRGVRGTDKFNNECDAIALLWVIYVRDHIKPKFPE